MNGKSKEPVVAALETWNDFDEKIYLGTKMGYPSWKAELAQQNSVLQPPEKVFLLTSEYSWSTESPPL
jgi:hypothetical protein